MSERPLVLASTSRYRRAMLESLGLLLEVEDPGVDEQTLMRGSTAPRGVAEGLASAKARAVASRRADAIVLAGDQVVSLDGDMLGKPGSHEAACAQLKRLAGKSHVLITSVCVISRGESWLHTDETRLTMRALTDGEIGRYVDRDQPFDCAGSYKFEALGIALFSKLETADPTAILGLPLLALLKRLRVLGIGLP